MVRILPEPPLRIVLGTDGLLLLRNVYERELQGLEQWQTLSASTDYDDLTPAGEDHPALQLSR
jgi:hypothetical protein